MTQIADSSITSLAASVQRVFLIIINHILKYLPKIILYFYLIKNIGHMSINEFILVVFSKY